MASGTTGKRILIDLNGVSSLDALVSGILCGRLRLEQVESAQSTYSCACTECQSIDEMWSAATCIAPLPLALERATRFIEAYLGDLFSVDDVAKVAHVARRTLYRLFIQHLGIPPRRYIVQSRLCSTLRLLADTELRVNEIFERAGLRDYPHAFRLFREIFCVTPLIYRDLYNYRKLKIRDDSAFSAILANLRSAVRAKGFLLFYVTEGEYLHLLADGLPHGIGKYVRFVFSTSPNLNRCKAACAPHQAEFDLSRDVHVPLIRFLGLRSGIWLPLLWPRQPFPRFIVVLTNPELLATFDQLRALTQQAQELKSLLVFPTGNSRASREALHPSRRLSAA